MERLCPNLPKTLTRREAKARERREAQGSEPTVNGHKVHRRPIRRVSNVCVRAALQQELDAEALPLDHRPVQRRHMVLVVAVWVGPGRDEVGDVEQLGVAHKHSLLQLPLQRRNIWRLPVDTRPVHLVERSQRGARSEAHAHAHAVRSSETADAPPPRVAVCRQGPPPPAARDRRPPARAARRASVRLPMPRARSSVDHARINFSEPCETCSTASEELAGRASQRTPWHACPAVRCDHPGSGPVVCECGRRRCRRPCARRERLFLGHGWVGGERRGGEGRGANVKDDQSRRQRLRRVVFCGAAQVYGLQARGIRRVAVVSARLLRVQQVFKSAGVRDCWLASPVLTRGGCASSDGKDTQRGFDVLISSDAHGLTIGRQGLFPAWSFSSDHQLELIETAGWLVTGTNQPPRSLSARERLSYFRMHPTHRVSATFLPLYLT
jgi:hypothetical protein